MMVELSDYIAALPKHEQDAIETRAAQLLAEEMSLRDMRRARDLSQEQIARILDINQANVSQMEARADLLISTLRSYVEAMGGELSIIAQFQNRPPIKITGFSDLTETAPIRARRKEDGVEGTKKRARKKAPGKSAPKASFKSKSARA